MSSIATSMKICFIACICCFSFNISFASEHEVPDETRKNVESTWHQPVYFAFNSAELDEYAKEALRQFLSTLNTSVGRSLTVEVTGNTDSVGSYAANVKLARKRAESVREFILSVGLPVERWAVGVKGEGEPLKSNQTARGRQENRRVDLRVYARPTTKTMANIKDIER